MIFKVVILFSFIGEFFFSIGSTHRIRSNNLPPFGEVNSQASLRYLGLHFCTAALVTTKKFITTASCINKVPKERRKHIQILVGTSVSTDGNKSGLLIPSAEIVINPRYDGSSHDIALIILTEFELKYGKKFQSSFIMTVEDYLDRIGYVSGFIKKNEVYSLVSVKMKIMDQNICREQYKKQKKNLPEDQFCGTRSNELTSLCDFEGGSY